MCASVGTALTMTQDASEKFDSRFELGTGIYVTAEIKDPQRVGLWLGVRFRFRFRFLLSELL